MAERGAAVAFASTENCTEEVPAVPEDVIVSQVAPPGEEEFQAHAAGAMTRTDPPPPDAGADADADSSA
jgi:hypothetical protein